MTTIYMTERTGSGIVEAIQEYGKRLFSFIRQRVKTDEDAEDILQDVWYQLSNTLSAEPIEQIGSWLYTVARNKITDTYRKQKPIRLDDFVYEDEEGEINYKDLFLADLVTPEDSYERQEFWDRFGKALNELPTEQRQVFVWNELEDITFREIAEKTGENIKTLISRKRYAVNFLRKQLESVYEEIVY